MREPEQVSPEAQTVVLIYAALLILVFGVGLRIGVDAGALKPPVPVFNPSHAEACRVQHAIAHTAWQRTEATLACLHPAPDQWLGELHLRTRAARP